MAQQRTMATLGRGSLPGQVHATTVPRGLLSLQARAGNRAVAQLVAPISQTSVQRCGAEVHPGCPCADEEAPVQRADLGELGLDSSTPGSPAAQGDEAPGALALSSPRFVGDTKLEACLNDRGRLGQGDRSESTARVQQALIDLGHDLGPTGADLVYGSKTAAAVRQFKTDEGLGSTQFGDVGPGTMGRLDELFPGALPPCPVDPDVVAASESQAFAVTASLGPSPIGAAFGIPGLLCQIKPATDPVPTNFGAIRAATRAALVLSTARHEESGINATYQVFPSDGGAKRTGQISSTPIFGDGVPAAQTPAEQDIRDGLIGVASFVIGSKPTGLPVGQTTTLNIADVPGRKVNNVVTTQPGGIFRFTHVALAQGPHLLIERLGAVASRAPGAATATTAAAFAAAFAAERFTLVLRGAPGAGVAALSAAQIRQLDQGLRLLGAGTLARIGGTRFDRSAQSTINNEEGSYDPDTQIITLVEKAFGATATSPGGFAAGQFTLQHEVGHALADRDAAVMPLFTAAAAGTPPLTSVGAKSSEENFAESVALFSVDREQLRAMRPAVFAVLNTRYPR